MRTSWGTAAKRISGRWSACCTTWILSSGRNSTAKKRPSCWLRLDDAFVHAVCSHGYGLCSDVEPVLEMEKVLFAADELTGLVGAAALMRPSKSVQDMELSSLKKKFKDKKFAAGCSRDVIRQGAERLGWELDRLLDSTLQAMRACEDDIAAQMASL